LTYILYTKKEEEEELKGLLGLDIYRKALKCKPSAHCACAVPLMDGLGYEYVLLLVSTLL
jgi:hypothetical protein